MNRVLSKLPLVLVAFALVISGCAAPKGQMREPTQEAAIAKVLSVTGEEMPDRVRLRIEGSTTLAYTVFRLSEPLRLIVDLADADVTGLDKEIDIDLGNVTTVSPLQFDETAGRIGRLEVSLLELWDYETQRDENSIIIDFLKPVAAAEQETTPETEPGATAEPQAGVVEMAVPGEAEEAEAMAQTEAVALPAAGFINNVQFEEYEGGLIVQFLADGAVSDYNTMELAGPTRLVLDVMGVAKGFAPSRIPVGSGGVAQIRVGEHYDQNKLRFVLDMEGDTLPPYLVQPEGSKLVVRLGEEAVAAGESATQASYVANLPVVFEDTSKESDASVIANLPVVFATPTEEEAEAAEKPAAGMEASGPAVSDIRYRPEAGGGAVLIISDSPVEYTTSQPDASHLLVDLKGVDLPRELVRSEDTRNEEGLLRALSSYNPRGGQGARVSLAFAAGTGYDVDQSGNTLTISLMASPATEGTEPAMAMTAAPAEPTPQPEVTAPMAEPVKTEAAMKKEMKQQKYTGEKITLDFQNADLLNVLRLIAEVSGLNIITAEGVGGKLTMRMVDVPWDQALEIILKTKGLGQVKEGNVMRIAPMATLEKERVDALRAKEADFKVEDLTLEIIPISYSKASELVDQLSSFLSSRGSLSTDERTNSLIVKDTESSIQKIKDLVATLDIPTPQVRIEARIVIVDEAYIKNLGIQWGGEYVASDGTRIFGESGTTATTFSNALVNLPASNANTILGVSFGSVDNFTNLDLRLSALEQTNNGKIISSPSLLVIQNETANIEVNNPFPENRTSTSVDESGATTTTSVTFPDIWTRLRITPQVTSNRDIFMDVFVEKDSKGQTAIFDNNTFTGVNAHKLETKIILKNSGTAVIGGVYTENEIQSNSSVPFISKVPVLGWLFKNKNTDSSRDELLIFINATIVES